MPLNLSSIKKFLEKNFDDTCMISRDPSLTADDVWDDATGTYTRPANDDESLFVGPCMIWIDRSVGADQGGGEDKKKLSYFCSIPLESVIVIRPEDRLVCLTSLRDPGLVGLVFVIDESLQETHAVSRDIRMHRLTSVPR